MDVVSPLHKKSFDEPKALWQCLQIVLTKLFTQIQEFKKKTPNHKTNPPHSTRTCSLKLIYPHWKPAASKKTCCNLEANPFEEIKTKAFFSLLPPSTGEQQLSLQQAASLSSSLQAEELQMLEFNSVFLKDFLRTFSALWGVLPQPELLQLKKPLTLSNLKFMHSIRLLKKPSFREGLFKLFQHCKTVFVALK